MFVKAKSGKTSKYGIKGKPGKKTKATNEKTTVQKINSFFFRFFFEGILEIFCYGYRPITE